MKKHPHLMCSSVSVFVGEVQIIAMAGITVAKLPTAVNIFAYILRAFRTSLLIRKH